MVAANIRPMVRPVPMAIQSWIRQAMPQSCKIKEDLWSQREYKFTKTMQKSSKRQRTKMKTSDKELQRHHEEAKVGRKIR